MPPDERHSADTARPSKWRKRPVEIEAMRLTWENRAAVAAWCDGRCAEVAPSGTVYAPGILIVTTLEGAIYADEGDWIIKGVADEFYPCKPAIFAATYERADGALTDGCQGDAK